MAEYVGLDVSKRETAFCVDTTKLPPALSNERGAAHPDNNTVTVCLDDPTVTAFPGYFLPVSGAGL